jgi:hypothetical protein
MTLSGSDDDTDQGAWTLLHDITFQPPVWDVTELLRTRPSGEPPLIHIGDKYTLWDADGRQRDELLLFYACCDGNLLVPEGVRCSSPERYEKGR